MKTVTKRLIKEYGIKKVDFMGYKKANNDIFTFHHLIVPARYGGVYKEWNGAVLCGNTSHPYIHVIENIDPELFVYITNLILDEKYLGRLDLDTLRKIDDVLKSFEKEHDTDRYKNKKLVIKPEYRERDYSGIK